MDVTTNTTIDDAGVASCIEAAIRAVGGCSAWAKSIGISKSYGHDRLHGRRKPSDRILAALGLERVPSQQASYREITRLTVGQDEARGWSRNENDESR